MHSDIQCIYLFITIDTYHISKQHEPIGFCNGYRFFFSEVENRMFIHNLNKSQPAKNSLHIAKVLQDLMKVTKQHP